MVCAHLLRSALDHTQQLTEHDFNSEASYPFCLHNYITLHAQMFYVVWACKCNVTQ